MWSPPPRSHATCSWAWTRLVRASHYDFAVTSATGAKRTLKKATLLRHADIPSGSAVGLCLVCDPLSVVGEDASVDHHGVERMFVQEDGEVRKMAGIRDCRVDCPSMLRLASVLAS